MPHCAVLGSFFLKVADWKKLEKVEVTSLSDTREQSSLHYGLGSGSSPVISLVADLGEGPGPPPLILAKIEEKPAGQAVFANQFCFNISKNPGPSS